MTVRLCASDRVRCVLVFSPLALRIGVLGRDVVFVSGLGLCVVSVCLHLYVYLLLEYIENSRLKYTLKKFQECYKSSENEISQTLDQCAL